MPAIQDVYSVNVSNRFALEVGNVDLDPLDELQTLEEQSKRQRELKKKVKTQSQNEKSEAGKKEVQFKENKDANVLSKKSSGNKKDDKLKSKKEVSSKENAGKKFSKDEDSQKKDKSLPTGDENRRPRRQNNQRWERQPPRDRFGEGDQYRPYDDPSDRPNRRGPGNADNEDRVDRRDRGGSRYERYRGNRGGFRGGQYGYGSRGNSYRNDGRDDRGKREFDRRSGSDKARVRPVDKRDGAGPRNWGTPGNEIEDTVNHSFGGEESANWGDQVENEEHAEDKQQKEDAEGEDQKETTEAEQPAPIIEEEVKGPAEMTLDEWRAKQNTSSRRKQFKIRKPGEGEDSSKWSNMKMIHEPTFNKPVLPPVTHDENPRKQGGKQSIDVEIRFDMPPRSGRGGRGRGFRGGRGSGYRGGRGGGGGGRYGNKYENQHAPPPDVLNEKEFPTLSAA